jgi:hypothetical protein
LKIKIKQGKEKIAAKGKGIFQGKKENWGNFRDYMVEVERWVCLC